MRGGNFLFTHPVFHGTYQTTFLVELLEQLIKQGSNRCFSIGAGNTN